MDQPIVHFRKPKPDILNLDPKPYTICNQPLTHAVVPFEEMLDHHTQLSQTLNPQPLTHAVVPFEEMLDHHTVLSQTLNPQP